MAPGYDGKGSEVRLFYLTTGKKNRGNAANFKFMTWSTTFFPPELAFVGKSGITWVIGKVIPERFKEGPSSCLEPQ